MGDPKAIVSLQELRNIVKIIKSPVYQKQMRPGKDQDFLYAMHHLDVCKKELKGSRRLVQGFEIYVKLLEGKK